MQGQLKVQRVTRKGAYTYEHPERVHITELENDGLAIVICNHRPTHTPEGEYIQAHNGYSRKYRLAAAREWLRRHSEKFYCDQLAPAPWKADSEARLLVAKEDGTLVPRMILVNRDEGLQMLWYDEGSEAPLELHELWSLAGWVTEFGERGNEKGLSPEEIANIRILAAQEILRRYPTPEEAFHTNECNLSPEFRHPEAYTKAQEILASLP